MAYVQRTKIASWKRFTIRTTAILAVAIVCGLSTAGCSEEQGGGKREIDVAYGKYGPAVYSLLTKQGGLTDSWSDARGGELGLTWGHDEFLSDRTIHFIYRLDLILFRAGSFEASDAVVVDPVIGSSAPFWFSDHAGVFATLAIK